jgi:putative phosphoesterase
MKIGVTGDTHGSVQAIRKVLQKTVPVEQWLHTGDYARDANILATSTSLPVVAVRGNCDSWEHPAKVDVYLEFEGFKIWLTHGNKYLREGGVQELAWWGHKLEMDVVVFGHTHVPLVEEIEGTLLFNPGSPSLPRGGFPPSFGILTLKPGKKPRGEICFLKEPGWEKSWF